MKNKFVTAVTAASLLATIFGSSVMAAGRTPVVTTGFPIAKYTLTPTEGTKLTESTAHAFGFFSEDSNKISASVDATLTFQFFIAGSAGVGTADEGLETADLKAVSSNSNILVRWAYADADGAVEACSANEAALATSDVVEGVSDATGPTEGLYTLCIAAKTATTAATGTITVSASKVTADASSWVTMKTITVTAVGPLDKLELSLTDSYKYVAGDNEMINNGLTLVGKDAAGTVINGATGSITDGVSLPTVQVYAENPTNVNEDPIAFFDGASGEAVDDEDSVNDGSLRLFDIEANTCTVGNGDEVLSDAGRSYSLKVEDEAGLIVSNAISITCTGDGSEAVVKSAAAEVTTFKGRTYEDGLLVGSDDQFDITATIVDENGLPLGNGASTDFGAVTLVTTGVDALHFTTGYEGQDVVNGKVVIAEMAPAALSAFKTYKYSIKVADSDLATTLDVAKTFAFTYTITNPTTITVKMNAAKTVATVTVNFGEDAAGESAYLDVETSTGSLKTYRKIANASGVATWTVALRRQYVFMSANSDVTGVEDSNLAVVTYK